MRSVHRHDTDMQHGAQPGRGLKFWIILLALCITQFLSALELTAVSTALPTIAAALHGRNFIWVGVAYALAATAVLPMSGGLAQIFGRRPSMLGCIAFFAVGSAICGASKNMDMLIAGRTIQGIGGGAILSLSTLVLADMVSLAERGPYAGLFGLMWSIAAAIGPLVGGSLSSHGQWRWLFYLNIPLCALSALLVFIFLELPTPPGTLREKLTHMDWIGNFLVITSSCSTTVALTWGGIDAPWRSGNTLAPLVFGVVGLALFLTYEALWAKHPLVPFYILSNRTSISGYMQTFLLPVTSLAVIYFVPVYFQACKDADAVGSGVLMLGQASIAPGAIIGGISVKISKRYRPQLWMGWCLMIIGASCMTLVTRDTSPGVMMGFLIIYAAGAGLNYSVQIYPVLAALPVTANAHALAFFSFLRSFAGVWGVTLGGAILQNELLRLLPTQFIERLPDGVALAYSAIPQIRDLPQPLKDDVRQAFAQSLLLIWKVLAGVCGLGLLSTLWMEGLPLPAVIDDTWAPKEKYIS